jgi:hypothetical protein
MTYPRCLYPSEVGGVRPPLEGPPEPGNRFVSFVRACARLEYLVKIKKCMDHAFPFPFWFFLSPSGFPFSLERSSDLKKAHRSYLKKQRVPEMNIFKMRAAGPVRAQRPAF